jgi:RimJ/RimL family protein N-acetyltransferase
MINAGDLVLKRWEPEWAEELTTSVRASLPELMPFMPWAHDGYEAQDAQAFLELSAKQWEEGTAFNYAAFTPLGEIIGAVGLMTRMGPGVLEIGYWINSAHTGRGYATRAAKVLADVGLRMPGIERLAIKHDAANPASGKVAANAGFREVERVEREPQAPGESGVEVVWELRPRAI